MLRGGVWDSCYRNRCVFLIDAHHKDSDDLCNFFKSEFFLLNLYCLELVKFHSPQSRPNPAADPRKMRRIIAEDPEWNLETVAPLVETCIARIATNFHGIKLRRFMISFEYV